MEELQTTYKDALLYVFDAKYVKENIPLAIIKDDIEIKEIEGIKVLHYSDNFESLVTFNLPTKNRKKSQMISLQQSMDIIKKAEYGVLSFTYDDIPYSVGLNHVYMNDKLYFHCAKAGFKLHSTECPVSYLVVDDLGISEPRATHNHESVMIQGTTHIVEDKEVKQKVLKQLMLDLAPSNHKDITEPMINGVTILELDIMFLHGKSHIRH